MSPENIEVELVEQSGEGISMECSSCRKPGVADMGINL